MNIRQFRSIALIPLFPMALAACGGVEIGAGEYDTFRIATVGKPTTKGDCGESTDTTTFRSGSTISVYGVNGGTADELFLDTGSTVLVGSKQENGTYEFSGKSTQSQDQGGGTVFTSTNKLIVTFVVDGTSITGEGVNTQTATCKGSCQGFDDTSCTTSASFDGVEVNGDDASPNPG